MNRVSLSRSRRAVPVAAVAAPAAPLLAGCCLSGGQKAQDSGNNTPAGKASTPRMTIAMVTHAPAGDTFWDTIRKGALAAAAKDNVKLVYSSDENAGDQANLARNAINQQVDGIAVTLAKPDAMQAVVAKAKKAGIPVVRLGQG